MSQKAIIFSAPSGAGKTTIVKYILKKIPQIIFSISATTRSKRVNEENRVDYIFMSKEKFKEKIEKGEFIEWEEVYNGTLYGTLKAEIGRIWDNKQHVIFDVDVVGGVNLKKYFKQKALSIFIKPPSLQILEQRLRNRNTEESSSMEKRISKAKYEMEFEDQFDIVLINDNIETCLNQAESIIKKFINN